MSAEENKATVRRCWDEVINQRHVAEAAAYIPAHNAELVPGILAIFPDLRQRIEWQVAEGDLVASGATYRGTHQGEWMGIAPTGKPVTLSVIYLDRVADGRIVEHQSVADWLGALEQVGARIVAGEA